MLTHVDKQVCGNGFTTAFFKLKPFPGKVNILIAPNKAVVIGKEEVNTNNRIKYFYKGSKDTDFNHADVLAFVADSFILYADKILEINKRIDKILIDEFHSVEIQSVFRHRLVDFCNKVREIAYNPNISISTVTATPNHFAHRDILIKNDHLKDFKIHHSRDREKAVESIKVDIKSGSNVIVFTNSQAPIVKLKDRSKTITANFIIGTKLFRSIVGGAKIVIDKEASLTIVSSRGFEGFDLHKENARVYFLEDRGEVHETFYHSNLIQAINRNRLNNEYIEYNRIERAEKRKDVFNDIDREVDEFIGDHSVSVEHKQSRVNKRFHPYVIFQEQSDGSFSINKNQTAINLYKETRLYDRPNWKGSFSESFNERNISINTLDHEMNNKIRTRLKAEAKKTFLLENLELCNELDLFGSDFTLEVKNLDDPGRIADISLLKKYHKHLEDYLMKKRMNEDFQLKEREEIAYDLLDKSAKFNKLLSKFLKVYNDRADEKYEYRKARKKKEDFKKNATNILCQLILAFTNERIYFPSKIVAHRDYNLTTKTHLSCIEVIAETFNVELEEVDIRTCNPRILYALNGLVLPNNFYGENKKNKKAINSFLNSFRYDQNKDTPKKIQKSRAIEKFYEYEFHPDVVEYLMINFFEAPYKGDLFNHLSFHEKNIIKQIYPKLEDFNEGMCRRHDSIILFNNRLDLEFLNEESYEGVNGWFEMESKEGKLKNPAPNKEDLEEVKKPKEVDGVLLL